MVVPRFLTSAVSVEDFAAIVESSFEDWTTKFVKSPPSSWLSSWNRVLLDATAGFRYAHAACASAPLPANCEPAPWIRFWSPFSVGGLSVLNSSSMSTALVVSCGADDPADGDRRRVPGAEPQVDVAVRDPRQGRQPHGRLGALVQRLVRRVRDVDRQLRLAARASARCSTPSRPRSRPPGPGRR